MLRTLCMFGDRAVVRSRQGSGVRFISPIGDGRRTPFTDQLAPFQHVEPMRSNVGTPKSATFSKPTNNHRGQFGGWGGHRGLHTGSGCPSCRERELDTRFLALSRSGTRAAQRASMSKADAAQPPHRFLSGRSGSLSRPSRPDGDQRWTCRASFPRGGEALARQHENRGRPAGFPPSSFRGKGQSREATVS